MLLPIPRHAELYNVKPSSRKGARLCGFISISWLVSSASSPTPPPHYFSQSPLAAEGGAEEGGFCSASEEQGNSGIRPPLRPRTRTFTKLIPIFVCCFFFSCWRLNQQCLIIFTAARTSRCMRGRQCFVLSFVLNYFLGEIWKNWLLPNFYPGFGEKGNGGNSN
jgi:hypothetical protein